jgi:hypothetical protein
MYVVYGEPWWKCLREFLERFEAQKLRNAPTQFLTFKINQAIRQFLREMKRVKNDEETPRGVTELVLFFKECFAEIICGTDPERDADFEMKEEQERLYKRIPTREVTFEKKVATVIRSSDNGSSGRAHRVTNDHKEICLYHLGYLYLNRSQCTFSSSQCRRAHIQVADMSESMVKTLRYQHFVPSRAFDKNDFDELMNVVERSLQGSRRGSTRESGNKRPRQSAGHYDTSSRLKVEKS